MTKSCALSAASDATVGMKAATGALALLRIAIGWHFLYEGIVKILDPGWTAAGYLTGATGPAAGLFHGMAANGTVLSVVNQLNIWGLVLIGLCLMLGLVTRFAALCGMALLALYYAANPPLLAAAIPGTVEGHYLLVNKNLVELLALAVVVALPARTWGLDGFVWAWCCKSAKAVAGKSPETADAVATNVGVTRRDILAGLSGIPAVGALGMIAITKHGWTSHEEEQLSATNRGEPSAGVDATARPSRPSASWANLNDLKQKVPVAKIGNVSLSRVIMGGNLIGGWAHARDLLYASDLVRAYHTPDKIYETLSLAEACGINTLLTSPMLCEVVVDYHKRGGKIQFISDLGGRGPLSERIKKSVDAGACSCYLHGGMADVLVASGKVDEIAKSLEEIRRHNMPAGIAGHFLKTVKVCAEAGLKPDYWMKTLHHHNYWSARPEEGFKFETDNIFCDDPQGTIDFMKDRPEPWIAYKILAAGAIKAKDGFRYALEGGADFICVGMYDFQVVSNANLAVDLLGSKLDRARPWVA